MKIHVIESGSRGNATLIEHNKHLFMIDNGVPLFVLENALKELGYNMFDIDALFVTHLHSDHTKGIKYMPPLPIYCTKGTYEGNNVIYINQYEPFKFQEYIITPVSISHDVPNPVGFIIENENEKLVYLTDTGYIPEKTLSYMYNATYYVIESNHNRKMLYACDRPLSLKERISSDTGHLSNEDAARYMVDLVGEKTKAIVLAHISLESNTYELAKDVFIKKFKKHHIPLDDLEIVSARQDKMVSVGKDN